MHQDVDLVMEMWSGLRPFIPHKDRLDAADHLVAVLDEFHIVEGIENMDKLVDPILGAAIKSRYGIIDEQDDEIEDIYENQY